MEESHLHLNRVPFPELSKPMTKKAEPVFGEDTIQDLMRQMTESEGQPGAWGGTDPVIMQPVNWKQELSDMAWPGRLVADLFSRRKPKIHAKYRDWMTGRVREHIDKYPSKVTMNPAYRQVQDALQAYRRKGAENIARWSGNQFNVQNLAAGKLTNLAAVSLLAGGGWGLYRALKKKREIDKLDEEMAARGKQASMEKTAFEPPFDLEAIRGQLASKAINVKDTLRNSLANMARKKRTFDSAAMFSSLPIADKLSDPASLIEFLNPFFHIDRAFNEPMSTTATALPYGLMVPALGLSVSAPFLGGLNLADTATDKVRESWLERKKRKAREEYEQILSESMPKLGSFDRALEATAEAYADSVESGMEKTSQGKVRYYSSLAGGTLLTVLLLNALTGFGAGQAASKRFDPNRVKMDALKRALRLRRFAQARGRSRIVPIDEEGDLAKLGPYEQPIMFRAPDKGVEPAMEDEDEYDESKDLAKLSSAALAHLEKQAAYSWGDFTSGVEEDWGKAKGYFAKPVSEVKGLYGGAKKLYRGARNFAGQMPELIDAGKDLWETGKGVKSRVMETAEILGEGSGLPEVEEQGLLGGIKTLNRGGQGLMKRYDEAGGKETVEKGTALVDAYTGIQSGDWSKAMALAKKYGGNFMSGIWDRLGQGVQGLGGLVQRGLGAFGRRLGSFWDKIPSTFRPLFTGDLSWLTGGAQQ